MSSTTTPATSRWCAARRSHHDRLVQKHHDLHVHSPLPRLFYRPAPAIRPGQPHKLHHLHLRPTWPPRRHRHRRLWEKYFAPVQYFPWYYLKDRTILGYCMMYGFMFISIFCWDTYYQSYLEVVHFQSITNSGYILNTFAVSSAFISPLIAVWIRYFGNLKWPSLAMIPIDILGTALLVRFRTPDTDVGVLVMCQIFNGFSNSVWALTGQLAIMSIVDHQHIAVAIALFGLFGSIGQAIGFAVAGGIWTNSMHDKMFEYLPDASKNMTDTIYGDIEVQLNYTRGSPERDAIIHAYSDAQRVMAIAGSCVMAACIARLFLWWNINVRKLGEERGKQTKGMVW